MDTIDALLDAAALRLILWLGSKGVRWRSSNKGAAHHEAAHALACVRLRQLVVCVFLSPDWSILSWSAQGSVQYDSSRCTGDKAVCDRNDVIELLMVSFAGKYADALFFPHQSPEQFCDYDLDMQGAHTTVRRYLAEADPELGKLVVDDAALQADPSLRSRFEESTRTLFAEAEARTEEFVLCERETIDALAGVLAAKGYVSYKEICAIVEASRHTGD